MPTAKRSMMIAAFASLPLLNTTSAVAGDLTIDVRDIRGTEGKLQVAVFTDKHAYKALDISHSFALFTLTIQPHSNAVTLRNVPEGRYAVSLFHDENGNNKLESNVTGMPTEGYGTSNARSKYDELSFSEAGFEVGQENTTVEVTMHYLGDK